MAGMQYFVVMIDYGRRGREAIVDPEITRREVISRVASGEYQEHQLHPRDRQFHGRGYHRGYPGGGGAPEIPSGAADLQANRFDHARDLRKHEDV